MEKYETTAYNIFRSDLNVVFVGINNFGTSHLYWLIRIESFVLFVTLSHQQRTASWAQNLTVILDDIFVLEAYAACTACLPVFSVGSQAYGLSAPFSHYIMIELKINIYFYNQILKLGLLQHAQWIVEILCKGKLHLLCL